MHDLYNRYTGQKSHDAARYFDGWNVVDEIVEVIVKVVKADCDEPIILAGHSYGGVSALQVARKLEAKKVCCSKGGKTFDLEITISLLLLVDAVAVGREGNARDIPSNVARTVNWYQKKGLVHGQAVSGPATVVNRDWTGAKFSKGGKVTREEISHTNIDDDEVFQDQAIREINAHDRFRDPTKWAR
jgi:pimeloyl-ACP methyl ester carboxylesterase